MQYTHSKVRFSSTDGKGYRVHIPKQATFWEGLTPSQLTGGALRCHHGLGRKDCGGLVAPGAYGVRVA